MIAERSSTPALTRAERLLAEAWDLGVEVTRAEGRRLRCRPTRGPVSTRILDALRVHKTEILDLLPPMPPELGEVYGVCFDCGTAMPAAQVVIGICFPCHRKRNPDAVEVLDDADLEAAEADTDPPGPWRVMVDSIEPVSGPVEIDRVTRVVDPRKCIASDLVALQRVVRRRNAGSASDDDLGEEILERLRACGAIVRLGAVQ